jgi:hypothetical protein
MKFNISYAITVCNELKELQRLIDMLIQYIRKEDEIIVLFDSKNGSKEVKEYLDSINITLTLKHINFHRIFNPLNNDFASFKNFLKDTCSKDYIFFIDADEYPSENIFKFLPLVLENNPIDVFMVPRINTVDNIGLSHINKWRWTVLKIEKSEYIKEKKLNIDIFEDQYNLLKEKKLIIEDVNNKIKYYEPIINFPDFQMRIIKNSPNIKWEGKVHEKIVGYKTISHFPTDDEDWVLFHPKTIDRQEKQNNFYNLI